MTVSSLSWSPGIGVAGLFTPVILVQAECVSIGQIYLYYDGSRLLGRGVAGQFTLALLFLITPAMLCQQSAARERHSLFNPAILVQAYCVSIGPICLCFKVALLHNKVCSLMQDILP